MASEKISRRKFLEYSTITAAGLTAGLSLNSVSRAAGSNKPNILYIFTDEQFAEAMSCAGCKDVKTPAMDSIAAMGVRFSRAYCTMPLCTPARASMWTGKMPHESGVIENTKQIPEHNRPEELGILLTEAGYDCQYAGKWHLPGYTLEKGHGFELLSRDGDMRVTKACVEYLSKKHNSPFFLVASYHNPHDICAYPGGRQLSKMPNGPIPEAPPEKWPQLPGNFGVPLREPPIIRQYQAGAKQFPTRGWDADRWRHYRYAYYRMCERVDSEIAQVLSALRQNGLEDNTVIIFSSDHGDGLGAHGWNQKWILYEEMAKVPFIISHKGHTKPGLVDDRLISQALDFYATVLDYANVSLPEDRRGRSLRAIAEGKEVSDWPDQVVCQAWMNYPGPAGRMIRTSRYKYTVWSQGQGREMLVDLKKDPGEMFNLAGNRKTAPILNEMRKRLTRFCTETNDPFIEHIPKQT